ncbi:hypothetical protein F5884DRAFT_665380, partial [Xylogone sp. PMI_703]
ADEQALVVLATPSFAASVSDDVDFIPKVLRRLVGKLDQPNEIDVLVAVVDGLSPTPSDISEGNGSLSPKEGFSFLYGKQQLVLPKLWSTSDGDSPDVGNQELLSYIKISGATSLATEVTLPLANTLFKNGRQSTLVASRWRFENEHFVKLKSESKAHQTINVFSRENGGQTSRVKEIWRVPAIPITPARRVASGLGNIVRQIDFGQSGVGPASRELEASMDAYLETRKGEKTKIAVWALIVPEDVAKIQESKPIQGTEDEQGKLPIDRSEIEAMWHTSNGANASFIGDWIKKGATFCRVLSGGGGWGPKQGLLSLDPQTVYTKVNEANFSFMGISFDDDESSSSSLGDLAKPGSYIQFFVEDPHCDQEQAKRKTPTSSANALRATVVGTIPSTVDEMPNVYEDANRDRDDVSNDDLFVYLDGHFGAVSERGMFIESSETNAGGRTVRSKIDMPYSFYGWKEV